MVAPPPFWAICTPRILAVKEGNMAGSRPTMRISFCRCLAAVAMPAISPPPPIGTGRTSRSGTSSSISSATVPWPAMTSMSLNGWTKVSSRSSHSLRAMAEASS